MIENCETEYLLLSKEAEKAIKNGNFEKYADIHMRIADVSHHENRLTDELRSRIVMFYFRISGISEPVCIDWDNINAIKDALVELDMQEKEFSELYFDIIRKETSPRHSMTRKGSYKLLMLCLNHRKEKVSKIIEILNTKVSR